MKTRTFYLPLVALSIFLAPSYLPAQIPHVLLYDYFSMLPAAPSFPSDGELKKTSPEILEDHSDLDEMGRKLLAELSTHSGSTILKEIKDEAKGPQTVTFYQDETEEVKKSHDELILAVADMQRIRTDFQKNFAMLEENYSKRSAGNAIRAIKDKINSEEYLLSIYINRMKPAFKIVDDLLKRNQYGDRAISSETKNVFRGAQQNEALILTDIIERLKLERITISNYARIIQQNK